jgi:hypothetical protein
MGLPLPYHHRPVVDVRMEPPTQLPRVNRICLSQRTSPLSPQERQGAGLPCRKSGDPGPLSHTGELCAEPGPPPDRHCKDCLPLNRLVVDAAASIYRQIYRLCPLARRPAAGGRPQPQRQGATTRAVLTG